MMTSDHIDHAAEAARVVQDVGVGAESSYGNAMAYAQVHATLALVEQQRIRNLIALAESGRTTVNGARQALAALYRGSAEEGSAHMALRPEIREALGIRE